MTRLSATILASALSQLAPEEQIRIRNALYVLKENGFYAAMRRAIEDDLRSRIPQNLTDEAVKQYVSDTAAYWQGLYYTRLMEDGAVAQGAKVDIVR